MFWPKYQITDKLLFNIKRVSALIQELNSNRFPSVVLMEFERTAREVSSFASTSIEGNPLPLTEVKKILKSTPKNLRQSEQEVINYNQALKILNEQLKKGEVRLSFNLVLNIHGKVMNKILSKNQTGKFRIEGVEVNNPKTGKTVYLPPDSQDTKALMLGLVDFINNSKDKIDPLILAGIFHKQMVLIHPFIDGNGRTARLVTKVLLAQLGLNTFNLFSFENYYNQNVTRYFETVGEFGNYYEIVKKIDFTNWLEYFTDGIIDELLRVQKILPESASSPGSQLKSYDLKILEYIQEFRFITDSDYAKLTDRAKATRSLDFKRLLDLGLIDRKLKGKATYYILKEK